MEVGKTGWSYLKSRALRTSDHRAGKIFAVVLISTVLIAAITSLLTYPISEPVRVGLLTVKAGIAGRGCITLALENGDLVLNGKRLSGNIVVSFGGEFHAMPVTLLAISGRVTVCFREGYERERGRITKRYAELGVDIGARGGEIIKRLVEQGVAAYTLPAVTVTLWLYDEEGYDYIYSEPISSVHYYLSRGYNYLDAFEKAFEDLLAVIREGVTVEVSLAGELGRYLVRVDKETALESVFEKLGVLGREAVPGFSKLAKEREASTTTLARASGVLPNLWNYPTSPDHFWRNRVSTTIPSEEECVENLAWQKFIEIYGSAYLFSKSVFGSPDAVRNYLNSAPGDVHGCFREGIKEMGSLLSWCLLPSDRSYTATWSHTMEPGTTIPILKPFVVQVVSSLQDPPPLLFSLVRGSFQGGYSTHGWSFLGTLIGATPKYWVATSLRTASLVVPGDWLAGRRYAAISVWARMRYYFDVLILTYSVRQYWGDPSYWVAIPIVAIIPYYIEEGELSGDWWDISWFDISGRCIAGKCWVSNINTLIQEWSGVYSYRDKLYYHLLAQATHDQVPTWDVIVDEVGGSENIVSGYCAAVLWGSSLSLLSSLFQVTLPSVSGAVSVFLSVIGTFIGYAERTFRWPALVIALGWRRTPTTSPQPDVKIYVEMLTHIDAVSNLLNITGKPPLVIAYRVIIYR